MKSRKRKDYTTKKTKISRGISQDLAQVVEFSDLPDPLGSQSTWNCVGSEAWNVLSRDKQRQRVNT